MYYSKGQKLLSAIILAVLFTCAVLTQGITWFTDQYWDPISAEFGGRGGFHNANIITTGDGDLALAPDFRIPGGRYSETCICEGGPNLFGDLLVALLLPSPPMNSGEPITDTMRGNMEALAEVAAEIGESVPESMEDESEE